MAVNSVSPGSYNSPSVQPQQPQAQTQRVQEKSREAKPETPPSPAERSEPTINTSGQTIGRVVNTKA